MIVATLPHTFPPRSAVLGWGRSLGICSVSGTCAKQSTNAHRCDTGRPEIPQGAGGRPERTGRVRLLLLHNGQRCSAQPPCASSREGAACARAERAALCTASLLSLCAACPSLAAPTPPAEAGAGAHTNRLVWGAVQQKNRTHSSHDRGSQSVCLCLLFTKRQLYYWLLAFCFLHL